MTQPEMKAQSFKLRQGWINEEVEKIRKDYNFENEDKAFQALAVSLIFDVDYEDIKPEEIVDGSQDKQIDIIRIEDDETSSSASIHIIQSKNSGGFGSNVLIQMSNGLNWIFGKTTEEVLSLSNERFKEKILEIRDIRKRYYNSNLTVSVYYVTNGDSDNLSHEYIQEKKAIIELYSSLGFRKFEFSELGASELYDLMNVNFQNDRKINLEFSIVYDINTRSLIEFSAGESKALICSITGEVLADIAANEPRDAIFDMNVRPFYGDRGKVNSDIKLSCISDASSHFWFLNNGVTMTCDKFEFNQDRDDPKVKVVNAQIVNGCQTTVTIREAKEKGQLKQDVKILLRIYATSNPSLIENITLTTNNQNKITDRDLRANDDFQRDMQKVMFERFGMYYERKNKEYRSKSKIDRTKIIPNTKAAQAYLAIVRRKPSIARGYLARIWSEHYEEVFKNATVQDLIYCFKIYTFVLRKGNAVSQNPNADPERKQNVIYGAFHIARIMGFLTREDNWGEKYSAEIAIAISRVENSSMEDVEFADHYVKALDILTQIRKEMTSETKSPALFFKNTAIQKSIETFIANEKAKIEQESV
jgi:AIPR protein